MECREPTRRLAAKGWLGSQTIPLAGLLCFHIFNSRSASFAHTKTKKKQASDRGREEWRGHRGLRPPQVAVARPPRDPPIIPCAFTHPTRGPKRVPGPPSGLDEIHFHRTSADRPDERHSSLTHFTFNSKCNARSRCWTRNLRHSTSPPQNAEPRDDDYLYLADQCAGKSAPLVGIPAARARHPPAHLLSFVKFFAVYFCKLMNSEISKCSIRKNGKDAKPFSVENSDYLKLFYFLSLYT
jgi:hypothetical protein